MHGKASMLIGQVAINPMKEILWARGILTKAKKHEKHGIQYKFNNWQSFGYGDLHGSNTCQSKILSKMVSTNSQWENMTDWIIYLM